MPSLLLELFSEEIPARMQAQAAWDLERLARDKLAEAGLIPSGIKTFAGPRRLTLAAEGLPPAQANRTEERKGPRVGAPDAAIEGFLRSTGLMRADLVERDGVYFATLHRNGRPTPEIIAEMVESIVRSFPWPKSMTWGAGKLRWVRPLHRILCVFDGEVVEFDLAGIKSGDETVGHRFMGSGKPFRAKHFDAYAKGLADNFVVLDPEERKARILDAARTLCFARNLELVEDQGLLDEVAGLTEWPVPLLGDMDPAFLDLPPEAIRTSMRVHQRYFAVKNPTTGALAPHFVAVANIAASDGGKTIAAGNARVLTARLKDARFFWDEDRRPGNFDQWLEKLKGVTFHAKLGTMYERVERIEALAREIAPLVGADPDVAARAARLAKADLASAMVGEFPELQGVMGRYYALEQPFPLEGGRVGLGVSAERGGEGADGAGAQQRSSPELTGHTPIPGPSPLEGEGSDVADAIRDHYRPQGPSDSVPTAPVSVAVALADKLDTLVGFFAIDEKPTGSRDPYALRRAALGVIRIVLENGIRLPLQRTWNGHLGRIAGHLADDVREALLQSPYQEVRNSEVDFEKAVDIRADVRWMFAKINGNQGLRTFLADRLKFLLRDTGRRYDLIDAVFTVISGATDDDLVRIVARVEALDVFLRTEDGANLLAGYKRAANILKAEQKKGTLPAELHDVHGVHAVAVDTSLLQAPEEKALLTAMGKLTPVLEAELRAENFEAAMSALAELRGPVDAFFDKVLVNTDDAAVRDNRLRLLAQIKAAMEQVADFSQVSG